MAGSATIRETIAMVGLGTRVGVEAVIAACFAWGAWKAGHWSLDALSGGFPDPGAGGWPSALSDGGATALAVARWAAAWPVGGVAALAAYGTGEGVVSIAGLCGLPGPGKARD